MLEVEIKVKIKDPEDLMKKFEERGGKHEIFLVHKDTYFNMPVGLRDFKNTDEALRLRQSISYKLPNKYNPEEICNYITYKGKKVDNSTKTREETEIQIEDFEGMKEILLSLGFQEVLTVVKERELYYFDHEGAQVELLIDYLPVLKEYFMEVELRLESSERLDWARSSLFKFLNQFGIKEEESIRESYLELILKKIKKDKKG